MKQRAVAIIADYLSHRPLGRVVGLKATGDDDYILAIEDLRDGRVHVVKTPGDLELWLKSFKTSEWLQPAFGLCGRCNGIHADRDIDGEVFGHCIPCQADLVEVAIELRDQREGQG
jgi:hypothetical protein